jgi:hypothetical protein
MLPKLAGFINNTELFFMFHGLLTVLLLLCGFVVLKIAKEFWNDTVL